MHKHYLFSLYARVYQTVMAVSSTKFLQQKVGLLHHYDSGYYLHTPHFKHTNTLTMFKNVFGLKLGLFSMCVYC